MSPWWLPPLGNAHWALWIALAVPLLGLDYASGMYGPFPGLFIIPVCLAGWYSGLGPVLALSSIFSVAQMAFEAASRNPPALVGLTVATVVRGAVITFMGLWVARLAQHERQLRRDVQTLERLLSICSFCKSIRNPSGEWEPLERFISRESSKTQFTHGLCPSCSEIHYPSPSEVATT